MKLIATLIFSLFCTAGVAQELAPQQVGVVEQIDLVEIRSDDPGASVHDFRTLGTEVLRLRFGPITVPEGANVDLVILDGLGEIVDTIRGVDLAGMEGQWTLPINGDYAHVALVGDTAAAVVKVSFDAIAREIPPGVAMSIIGPSELQPIAAHAGDAGMMRLARAVAKLEFVVGGKTFVCTGFLVGDDRLMTNDHCVNTQATCRTTSATFDYQRGTPSGPLLRTTKVRCVELVAHDKSLDVAVLRLQRKVGDPFGTLKLVSDEGLTAGTALFIIGHPAGRPKEISFRECAVTTPKADGLAPLTDIAHRCDTEGGSSGSPVFNSSGSVVGLHHFGVGEGPFWNQNRAVRMSLIIAKLKAKGLL